MDSLMKEVLEKNSPAARNLFQAMCNVEKGVSPEMYLPFFNAIGHISTSTEQLAQYIRGVFSTSQGDDLLRGLGPGKKNILKKHLESMVNSDKRVAHTALFKEYYKAMGYHNFDDIYHESSNPHCKYMVELKHMETDFKIAEKKISYLLALLEVVQYFEPEIMASLKTISLHSKNGKNFLFTESTLPEYLKTHERKDYYKQSLLSQIYHNDKIPSIVNDYCVTIISNMDKFFGRTRTLILEGGGNTFT